MTTIDRETNDIRIYLNYLSYEIAKQSGFERAVLAHHDLIQDSFKKKPFFFKSIFNSSRFIILLFILSVYYTSEPSYIEDVKRRCGRIDLISMNSISSFIMTLRVLGLIKVIKSDFDNRKLTYYLTERALLEAKTLINSMAKPLMEIFSGDYCVNSNESLRYFFINYSKIIFTGNFMHLIHPASSTFIMRDSGHMIITSIYVKYIRSKALSFDFELVNVAKECGVSRSHLKRCLNDAEKNGFLTLCTSKRKISITSKFIEMAERYMAIYLSAIYFGFRRKSPPKYVNYNNC
ncbi:hypothetical protein KGP26_29135 (plasmid) [Serratia sp. JSRIV002]|uniref:hypothetical protein n=1 Tax=Serratia sp. JSRIV002 TaxID=2831894 RepID=UPI001CBE32F5|nr:hypothetical protein [Serratia sp. JSRIV002]UAN54638.1 hypothetical protein KGP26_29135 [Serratia sp. JSRIV002]